jgi:hypothetical protein
MAFPLFLRGVFKFLVIKLRGRSDRQRILVRGHNYATEGKLVEDLNRKMMQLSARHGLAAEPIEVSWAHELRYPTVLTAEASRANEMTACCFMLGIQDGPLAGGRKHRVIISTTAAAQGCSCCNGFSHAGHGWRCDGVEA